jgi:hypothetical protein
MNFDDKNPQTDKGPKPSPQPGKPDGNDKK